MRTHRSLRAVQASMSALLGLLVVVPGAVAVVPIEAAAAAEHPAAYFTRARQAWDAGRRDDATFWLYVAQLRYRAHLAAHPGLDPTGDPALFASLMETVGRPINEYAFGDVAEATAVIDRALRWDEENPDISVPAAIRRRTRAGLIALGDDMRRSVERIREQRTINGLENR